MVYPIAEVFTSPQGEGLHSGVLMTFIRLAGCTVGKPFPKERYVEYEEKTVGTGFPIRILTKVGLPIYTEQCTLYDGRHFECDTDYRVKERLTLEQIVERVTNIDPLLTARHICISGGEPMMHNLAPLVGELLHLKFKVHLETSGTVSMYKAFRQGDELAPRSWIEDGLWITVSPKFGVLEEMVERADEIKLLVDQDFNIDTVPEFILVHKLVYLQPVNGEFDVNFENLNRCLELQKRYPSWRVSIQMHKIMNVR